MKVIVNGALGRMGREVVRLLDEGYRSSSLFARVDAFGEENGVYTSLDKVDGKADVIIDFSNHAATEALLSYAKATKTPVVLATTGHTEQELATVRDAAKEIPVFFSANMSLGVALLCRLAKEAASLYPDADIEIIEKHHNRKLDAPSGTALMLANAIGEVRKDAKKVLGRSGQAKREKNDIGIHAVRMGNIVGEHEILIGTDTETITLSHTAHSRSLFAEGAVVAAAFLVGQSAGLYNMNDMLK